MGKSQNPPHLREDHTRRNLARKASYRNLFAGLGLGLATLLTAQTPPPIAFDSAKAWSHLNTQVNFGPRKPGTLAHRQCRDFLMAELAKTCQSVKTQTFTHTWSSTGKSITMWNVIGEQNWADAPIRVALFAHWDTRPTADQERDTDKAEMPIPGANDGASGVAVLLELARIFKASPIPIGIQYVLVDGEDLGPGLDEMFLGARAYARNMGSPRPNYGILLDMIGDRDLAVPREPNSVRYAPSLVDALYAHAAEQGLAKSFPNVLGPEIEDDHVPLNQAGLQTIDLIDFSYPAWHTLDDTPDKCSAESLGKVGKLLESWFRKPKPFKISG